MLLTERKTKRCLYNPPSCSIFSFKRKAGATSQQLWKQTLSTIFITNLTALNGNCKCCDKNQLRSCLPHCCFNKAPLYLLLKPWFCGLLKQYSVLNPCAVPPLETGSECPDRLLSANLPFINRDQGCQPAPPDRRLHPQSRRTP